MYYCTKCGARIEDEETVCGNCGAEFEDGLDGRTAAENWESDGKKLQVSYTGTVLKIIILLRLIHTALTIFWTPYKPYRSPMLHIFRSYAAQGTRVPGDGAYMICITLWIVPMILILLSFSRMFRKCGYSGWGVIIPFYNIYCILGIAGKSGLAFILSYAGWVIMAYLAYITEATGLEVFFFPFIGLTVASVTLMHGFFKRFGCHVKAWLLVLADAAAAAVIAFTAPGMAVTQFVVLCLGFLWMLLILSMGWGSVQANDTDQCHQHTSPRIIAAVLIGLSVIGNPGQYGSGGVLPIPSVSGILSGLRFHQEYNLTSDRGDEKDASGTPQLWNAQSEQSASEQHPAGMPGGISQDRASQDGSTQDAASSRGGHAQAVCPTCGGSGRIETGGRSVCAICGGSGQQYIPNLYSDSNMNMYGGYVVCSGCSGSGYTGTSVWGICPGCGGTGVIN